MVANFEKLQISPGFFSNFRKVTEFQRVSLKAVNGEKNGGSGLGPNRIRFPERTGRPLLIGNSISMKIPFN